MVVYTVDLAKLMILVSKESSCCTVAVYCLEQKRHTDTALESGPILGGQQGLGWHLHVLCPPRGAPAQVKGQRCCCCVSVCHYHAGPASHPELRAPASGSAAAPPSWHCPAAQAARPGLQRLRPLGQLQLLPTWLAALLCQGLALACAEALHCCAWGLRLVWGMPPGEMQRWARDSCLVPPGGGHVSQKAVRTGHRIWAPAVGSSSEAQTSAC